ncbi:MAG: Wzz/FepE/Etk N-terminal domain-containing protein [Candidatus Omnitrophica bacterium]|nr:Wzz/FepE/Etk N-terminal domain-containing protein [Candidatus Omnitrophota bacterium]
MENTPSAKYQNPLSYLKLFFRRKWFIIVPTAIGLTLGIVAFFLVRPEYESYTTVLVEEQRTINPLIQDLAVASSVVNRLQSIREELLGWNSLADLAKKLKLLDKVENQEQYEGLVLNLRKKIAVQMSGAANIIRLSYRSKDPNEALLVAKTLSENFIAENLKTQTKETDVAIDFIKEQLQVYKRKIKESEVNDLEQQLAKLAVDSTEQHPMVRQLREKLDVAKKELESGEYKVDQGKSLTDPVRQALKQELTKMTGGDISGSASVLGTDTSDDPNAAIYKLFIMDKIDSARAADITVNQRIYDMLLQRLETAKITQRLEASKQGTRYTILDPARLPLKPKKPQIMWVAIGLFLGAGAGVGLVFMREFLDHSFLDIDDAKLGLELPILGAISRITTHEQISQEDHRRAGWIVLGAITCVVLITASGLLSLFKK